LGGKQDDAVVGARGADILKQPPLDAGNDPGDLRARRRALLLLLLRAQPEQLTGMQNVPTQLVVAPALAGHDESPLNGEIETKNVTTREGLWLN
jgi:hypothetical protein